MSSVTFGNLIEISSSKANEMNDAHNMQKSWTTYLQGCWNAFWIAYECHLTPQFIYGMERRVFGNAVLIE